MSNIMRLGAGLGACSCLMENEQILILNVRWWIKIPILLCGTGECLGQGLVVTWALGCALLWVL
jgi:hypothetical protein